MIIAAISDWIQRFASAADHIGLTCILSVICLLQYGMQIYRRKVWNRNEESLQDELKELAGEYEKLKREQSLFRMENLALQEVLSQSEPDRAIQTLMRIFVPSSRSGFAIFFTMHNQELQILAYRGLSRTAASKIQVDEDFLQQMFEEGIVKIDGATLYHSEFLTALNRDDRRKISELHLIPLIHGDDVIAVIATTQMFPQHVPLLKQNLIVSRLMNGLSENLAYKLDQQDQQMLLKLSEEKLALRSIADQHYDVPSRLIDDFLTRLASLTEVDRCSLMLITHHGQDPIRVVSRQGGKSLDGIEQKWIAHEVHLAEWALKNRYSGPITPDQLQHVGVDCLIGSALVIPLLREERRIGFLCMTRKDPGIYSSMQTSLAFWAGEFFADTLLKVVDRASIERKANFDGLTQLANRRTFDERITQEIRLAQQNGNECALCLLDLDHFKSINDRYGHRAGDEVLRQFASLLQAESHKLRSTDRPLVARYGGEEMALLLPGVGLQGASRIAETIRQATRDLVVLFESQRINFTVSIGIACYPRHAMTVEQLIESADTALYQAKRTGRDRVASYAGDQTQLTEVLA